MNRGLTRREFITTAACATIVGPAIAKTDDRLDRKKIVDRHGPVVTSVDIHSALQVGNGEFAFTMDVTGLQTFQEEYGSGMPLGTMAQWAWHTFPNTAHYELADVQQGYDSHGRRVFYPVGISELREARQIPSERSVAAESWLRENPHRIHLARIGLVFPHETTAAIPVNAISGVQQRLDLWTGRVESRFQLLGATVHVETACHPQRDSIAIRIVSPLLADNRLGVLLAFPYASGSWSIGYDWNSPDRYETRVSGTEQGAIFESILDETYYWSSAQWSEGTELRSVRPHEFHLVATGRERLDFTIEFSPQKLQSPRLSAIEVQTAAAEHWPQFWQRGGTIDFSNCTDERAPELERRVVLSQYVTAVNCAGSMPPQETGLVTNSWSGKSHLEMHWWHAAHFVLWGRPDLLERSLPWYKKILPRAQETARQQGYRGARWPKEVGPEGRETPSDIGVFLIWQQPHPIFYAELLYRLATTNNVLESYRQLVFETAEFMASYAAWDDSRRQYVLGPPLIPAQESYRNIRARLVNPTFELAYWHWGLSVAQTWRERLGIKREPSWDGVISALSPAPIRDGRHAAIAVEPYTLYNDHPSMLCALGMLPATPMIDRSIMSRTLDDVLANWNWKSTWGWDYPVMAMSAARLGQPEKAVDALLMQGSKNEYLPDGFNLGPPELPLYLPGNGGLLYATALMAAGWDGSSGRTPGFPKNGKWDVKYEGIHPAP
jgi:hypothetical protein